MPRKPKTFVTHPSNPIKTWSPSKASTFDECPSHAAFDVTHKPKEDMGPALVHGRKVHDELAKVAMGTGSWGPGDATEVSRYWLSRAIHTELDAFYKAREAGDAQAELEVAINRKGELVEWFAKDVWYRAKLDLLYRPRADHLVVSDWKTGRPAEKDKAQLKQYAWIGALLARVATIETRLIYLKTNTVDAATYTIAEVHRFAKHWMTRGGQITDPKLRIVATPSESACRYCPHAASKGGPCSFEFQRLSAQGLRHKWGGSSL
jgi:hypothetical protein